MTPEEALRLNESVAALTAEIYISRKLCDHFTRAYARRAHLERLQVIIKTAADLEIRAIDRSVEWDETHDWILCIEELAEQLAKSPDTIDRSIDWDSVFKAGRYTSPSRVGR